MYYERQLIIRDSRANCVLLNPSRMALKQARRLSVRAAEFWVDTGRM